MERHVGIEPTFTAWKAGLLAREGMPQMVPSPRIEREPPALQAGVQANYTS